MSTGLRILLFIFASGIGFLQANGVNDIRKYDDSLNTGVTTLDLQGYWTTQGPYKDFTDCIGAAEEYPFGQQLNRRNWFIKGDTIFSFIYPCQYIEKWTFRIRLDTMYVNSEMRPYCQVKFKNAKLICTFPDCVVRQFDRDTFDINTLQILKLDTINPDCLLGNMRIVTHFKPRDEKPFDEKPPVSMPRCINIVDRDRAALLGKTRSIILKKRGKKRLFHITQIGWSDSEEKMKHFIVLSPAEWWTKQPFSVRYEEE